VGLSLISFESPERIHDASGLELQKQTSRLAELYLSAPACATFEPAARCTGYLAHSTVAAKESIFPATGSICFAWGMMIRMPNAVVLAGPKVNSAADRIFCAAEKIISVITTAILVRATILSVASTILFAGEMIISDAKTKVEDDR
jgi:hypothetical protein